MKIERPNAPALTKADLQHLETLKALVEGAIADGVLTAAEAAYIKAVLLKDEVPPQELDLIQTMIWAKIQSGELLLEWS
ncbi:MAG: hypothetical protein HC929_11290 [Leptolyngbyaceae cyanobacterium SM2_5_2]|nr:hypothetical protein [Leptolyngbyaceae cyanobacterium SM2_5_2]